MIPFPDWYLLKLMGRHPDAQELPLRLGSGDITATGEKIVEDDEASRLDDIRLHFDLVFPDDQAGRQSAKMVERLLTLSHDRYCTVSRTIENGAPVTMTSEVSPDIAADSPDA